MRIGVDATSWQNNRGYGRHARSLLNALLSLDDQNRYTFFMDSKEMLDLVPDRAEVHLLASSIATAAAASSTGNRSLRDMWLTSRAMSSSSLDVLLFPTIYSFVPTYTRAKRIVVVHDTIAETFPQLTLPNRKARLFWDLKCRVGRAQADALVTVSEYSRRSIVNHFGLNAARIFVVGEASDPVLRRLPNVELTPALKQVGIVRGRRMLVYLGGFSPHKNIEVLIDGFAQVCRREEFSDTLLVLVGEYKKEVFHSYYGTVVAQIRDLGISDRTVFTGYLADEDLVVLLNLATVLVLPSLMEGFGLPAVEAAACGCPVIATTESPLPELLKDGGIFFDPRGGSLRSALETILGTPGLRDRMGAAALDAARRLTWTAAAQQMLDVITRVRSQ